MWKLAPIQNILATYLFFASNNTPRKHLEPCSRHTTNTSLIADSIVTVSFMPFEIGPHFLLVSAIFFLNWHRACAMSTRLVRRFWSNFLDFLDYKSTLYQSFGSYSQSTMLTVLVSYILTTSNYKQKPKWEIKKWCKGQYCVSYYKRVACLLSPIDRNTFLQLIMMVRGGGGAWGSGKKGRVWVRCREKGLL